MSSLPTAPSQPVRTIVKGSGEWVDEVYTDATSGKVVRITAYTADQLASMKTNITNQYNDAVSKVDGMIALLTPSA